MTKEQIHKAPTQCRHASPRRGKAPERYRYRGLPCSIRSNDNLWCVSGRDLLNGGSGVLEWCYDEEDAEYRLSTMKRFSNQFADLLAHKFTRENERSKNRCAT